VGQTQRQTGPRPGARKDEQEIEKEREGMRALIDSFRRQPNNDDDSGFYRKAGRLIARPVMKPQ
jgi:hypothetical protein